MIHLHYRNENIYKFEYMYDNYENVELYEYEFLFRLTT